jgi:glutathione peroxidase
MTVFSANILNFNVQKIFKMKTLMFAMILSATLTGGSIYDFKAPGLTGGTINFSDFKGKKILIVNTASKCGNTPQYDDLEKLYEKYKDKLVVVGFPANNFGAQEPGANEEIAEFCKKNYGVTFPMAGKVSVKGDDIDPLFKWLVQQSNEMAKNLPTDNSKDLAWRDYLRNPITWNFTKFLIDENGNLVAVFHNKVNPMSDEITKYLN